MRALPMPLRCSVLVALAVVAASPAPASAAVGLLPSVDSPVPVGGAPTVVTHGNFDGDSRIDLAVLDRTAETVTIWRATLFARFIQGSTLATGNSPKGIVVGEFNGDTDPDLAITNFSDGTVSIYTGTGAGSATFSSAGTAPAGTQPGAIVAGDFNGDGDVDLAVVNESGDTVSILVGSTNATFAAPAPLSVGSGTGPRGIAIGNINAGGDPDLVVGNVTTDDVKTFLGAGAATFVGSTTLSTSNPDPIFPAAADLNADGLVEVIVGHTSSNVLSVFPNSAGVFASPTQFTEAASVAGIAVTDVDGDNDPELLATVRMAQGNQLSVRKGAPGTGFFFSSGITIGDGAGSPDGATQTASTTQPRGLVFVPSEDRGTLNVFGTNDYHLGLAAVGSLDSVEVGKISTAVQRVTFTNDGFGATTPTSILITGNANDFLVGSNGCVGVEIAAGSSCTVDFRFAPTATGSRTAFVSVRDSGAARFEPIDFVTLTQTGVSPTPGPAGPAGPTGDTGATGPAGADGTDGTDGTNGTNGTNGIDGAAGATGPQGLTGAQGETGPAGSTGPQGATGPRGRPGRDARVTCRVRKRRGSRIRVVCVVRLVSSARPARVRVRLTRRGRLYARGAASRPRKGARVRLRTVRAIRAGRYRLTTVSIDRRGRRTVRRAALVVTR